MPSRRARQRLADILENMDRIGHHLGGGGRDAFLADVTRRDAVERCLERIAEAARKLGDEFDARFPAADLPNLRRLGSVLRHDYDLIEALFLWNAVERRLPPLRRMCEALLAEDDTKA
ncbi:MAG: DUF86 domain-containing protein [Hyphomicrobiales bacterium]|nr:DUF86 domain-containing protein [Hyphomicrobiales bacterium]